MTRPILSIAVASAAVLLGVSAVALDSPGQARATKTVPLEQTTAPATCDTPQHHQLDFWVGNWQVFDAATNKLVAIERVEKHSEGCIVQENLTFLTDMYRRPGVKYRLAGIGVNRFDGENWLQMWADNQWGAIFLRGAPDADGKMVFVTVIPSRKRDVKLVYENRPDGTVRILQYVAPAGSGKWLKYGDLINRPNR
ncbi:MAG: hypothetical protein WA803_04935 [Steroidobacteraceae bacterium]